MSLDDQFDRDTNIEYRQRLAQYFKGVEYLIEDLTDTFNRSSNEHNETFLDLLAVAFVLRDIFYFEVNDAINYINNFDKLLSSNQCLFNGNFDQIYRIFNEVKSSYYYLINLRTFKEEIFLIRDPSYINVFFEEFNTIFGTRFDAFPVEIQKLYDNLASLQPAESIHNLTLIITFVEVVNFVLENHPRQDDLEDSFLVIQNLLANIIRRNITVRFSEN